MTTSGSAWMGEESPCPSPELWLHPPVPQVPKETASAWCKEKDIPYFEVSAKNNINVAEAFETLAKQALSTVSILQPRGEGGNRAGPGLLRQILPCGAAPAAPEGPGNEERSGFVQQFSQNQI